MLKTSALGEAEAGGLHKFKASLGYIVRLGPDWIIE